MPKFGRLPEVAAALALAAFGCTGQVPGGEPPETDPGTGGVGQGGKGPGGGGAGGGNVAPGDPGHAVFRRLSRTEYNNTIRDLLGDTSNPANAFSPDLEVGRSGYRGAGSVATNDASDLLTVTEKLADDASKRLDQLMPCKPLPTDAAAQDTCAKQFVTAFGKRAFRRPLTADENAGLAGFYAGQRTGGLDFPNSMRMLISAILLSPQFLYRWEVPAKGQLRDGNLVRYSSYEMASRLSYLFWASMPDDTAFALADKNKLGTLDEIEAESRRLLKDPKAKEAISDFFTQWLRTTELATTPKDDKVYPSFTPELARSMMAETASFVGNAVIDGDGKLSTIFTSASSFVDANLAKLYNQPGVTGTTLVPATLNAAERGGILTQGSFLAQHASSDESNPVRRGKLVADRVLCVEPPPPPDVVPDIEKPMPNVSVRERFEKHDINPCAAACHKLFDPIGYAFENYNGIGAYQTQDGGKAVNATGTIKMDGKDVPFKNALELGARFGESKQVADCMARQFLRYSLRRKEDAGDEPSLSAALGAASKQSNNLRELLVAFTKTRAFTHRTPSIGEVLP
jgi:hypothetical protein